MNYSPVMISPLMVHRPDLFHGSQWTLIMSSLRILSFRYHFTGCAFDIFQLVIIFWSLLFELLAMTFRESLLAVPLIWVNLSQATIYCGRCWKYSKSSLVPSAVLWSCGHHFLVMVGWKRTFTHVFSVIDHERPPLSAFGVADWEFCSTFGQPSARFTPVFAEDTIAKPSGFGVINLSVLSKLMHYVPDI